MTHNFLFDSQENQTLLAMCARKTIRKAGVAAVVWGSINLVIGSLLVLKNPLNAGLMALGLLMLGAGIGALRKPSLTSLRTEAFVSVLLFCWNLGVGFLNARAGAEHFVNPVHLILPAVAAVAFYRQYRRLGHLEQSIADLDHSAVKQAVAICKEIFKRKVKRSPDVVEARSRRCRLKLIGDSIFCVQRNLTHAFSLSRTDFQQCIIAPDKKRLRVVVQHPLGKLSYAFDRKSSDKIKTWLGLAKSAV
jgi:hypothetical protein